MQCVILEFYRVRITNFKTYSPIPSGIPLSISGVVNPRAGSYASPQIIIYIYSSASHVQAFTYSGLGTLAFTPTAPVLLMPYFLSSTAFIRQSSSLRLALLVLQSASIDQLSIQMPGQYDLYFWKNQIINYLDSASVQTVVPSKRNVVLSVTKTVSPGDWLPLDLLQVYSPIDPGWTNYPQVHLLDSAAKLVRMSTYDNLAQYSAFTFSPAGKEILINQGASLSLEKGTFSEPIEVVFPETFSQDTVVQASHSADSSLVSITSISLPAG